MSALSSTTRPTLCVALCLDQDADPGVKLQPQIYNYSQRDVSIGWNHSHPVQNLKLGIRQARPNGMMNRN